MIYKPDIRFRGVRNYVPQKNSPEVYRCLLELTWEEPPSRRAW